MAATGRFRLVVITVAVVVSALGAVVWSRTVASEPEPDAVLDVPGEYLEPGSPTNPPLPTDRLPAVTLETAGGEPVELATDGRPMVVNLWFSTCVPCARELAAFAAVEADLGDDVRFVGVNPYDTASTMTRFAADRGVDYELLRDPGFELADDLAIVAYPVTLFVGADGRIVERTGPIDSPELRARIAEHWS
ncbi:MAG: TlpA disulfide reductase family protein [Ilumatobacteraceae bacterium]